jgi:hypothetical protein
MKPNWREPSSAHNRRPCQHYDVPLSELVGRTGEQVPQRLGKTAGIGQVVVEMTSYPMGSIICTIYGNNQ